MKQKALIIVLLILSLACVIFLACQDNTKLPSQSVQNQSSLNSKTSYLDADEKIKSLCIGEIEALLNIRNSIMQTVIKNNVDILELKKAYIEEDELKIKNLLKYSSEELNAMNIELKRLTSSIKNKVPEIVQIINAIEKNNCRTCDIEKFFNNFNNYARINTTINKNLLSKIMEEAGDNCHWVQYGACLTLCTLGGPIWYWPCAYLCLCSYCWGPTRDDICL